mgnify:CR=1 FL=1
MPGCERESDRGDESDGSGKSSQKSSGTGKYAPQKLKEAVAATLGTICTISGKYLELA